MELFRLLSISMDLHGPILLVEDNDDDAFFFEKAVQRLGVSLKVERVVDGPQAVEYLMKQIESSPPGMLQAPAMVMLDLKLPRMDGFEVLEWIRHHEALKNLRVNILSSSGEEADRLRASYLKADAYLVKPVAIEDYYLMVKQIWEQWLLPTLTSAPESRPSVSSDGRTSEQSSIPVPLNPPSPSQ
ncbi:MAG TPA: response regulator [Candidatus Saccharimonadales bacterium]|nr:response regulator [Candidatus Saccharimonadales bacterium]